MLSTGAQARRLYYWRKHTNHSAAAIGADLGSAKSITGVKIQQSDSDTVQADMMYHATLQYSADGTAWTDAGTFDNAPVISKTFASPVSARYVRIVAAAANPGGKWIKIREFTVSAVPAGVTSTVAAADGTTLADAMDGRVDTAWQGARPAVAGDSFTKVFEAQALESVTVVGGSAGTVQVRRGGLWADAGALTSGYTKVTVGGAPVDGVRLVFAAGGAPVVNEIILTPTAG